MSKLEYWLWGADFVIGGVGWIFGGAYAGILCFAVGGLLIFIALTKKDEREGKHRILIDEHTPYFKGIKVRHKLGLGLSIVFVVALIGYGVIHHVVKQDVSVASSPPMFNHVTIQGGKVGLLNCADNLTFGDSQITGGETGVINDPNGKADCHFTSDRPSYEALLSDIKRDAGSKALVEKDFDVLRDRLRTSQFASQLTESQKNDRLANLAKLEEAFLEVGDDREKTLILLGTVKLGNIK